MTTLTKKKWAGLVRDGKVAAEKEGEAKWELGRLALQVPLSKGGGHEKGDLRTYAEAIDVEYDILKVYRRVAEGWDPGSRVPGCSWTVHRDLLKHQHLIQPGDDNQRSTGCSGPEAGGD